MPKSPKNFVTTIVSEFVDQLNRAIEQLSADQARALIGEAFGGSASPTAPRRQFGGAPAAGRRSPRTGRKRDPSVIAATTERLGAHIDAHPGQRIEEIAVALRTTTKKLVLSVKKLIAGKTILARGKKRATRYFPVAGRSTKGAANAKATKLAKAAGPANRARSVKAKKPARSAKPAKATKPARSAKPATPAKAATPRKSVAPRARSQAKPEQAVSAVAPPRPARKPKPAPLDNAAAVAEPSPPPA